VTQLDRQQPQQGDLFTMRQFALATVLFAFLASLGAGCTEQKTTTEEPVTPLKKDGTSTKDLPAPPPMPKPPPLPK